MKVFFKFLQTRLISILFFFNNVQEQTKTISDDSTHSNKDRPYHKEEVEASFSGRASRSNLFVSRDFLHAGVHTI